MHDIETITFAGGTFDRAAHLRDDIGAQKRFLADSATKALVLWRGKFLAEGLDGAKLAWLALDHIVLKHAKTAPIFLGLQNGAPRYAFDISEWTPESLNADQPAAFIDESQMYHPDLPKSQYFADLRSLIAELSHADAGDAATAKGIFEWHRAHRFCANCGALSEVAKSGWQRGCPACKRQHFPRTDPVVIMLVTHGNDVLIGRSALWPAGMYSLLAGFMEPGETINEAVRREVFEETSVQIGNVEYLLDQPWPFPASLMIGCKATALSRDITLDELELENALWLSKEDALASIEGQNPKIKPARKGSIARLLLERWLADTID